MLINGVAVSHPESMCEDEAREYALDEIAPAAKQRRPLRTITLELDGDEVVVRPGSIKRVRRITGYLSEVGNFNEAKRLKKKIGPFTHDQPHRPAQSREQ